jgi:hypothetical protein
VSGSVTQSRDYEDDQYDDDDPYESATSSKSIPGSNSSRHSSLWGRGGGSGNKKVITVGAQPEIIRWYDVNIMQPNNTKKVSI